MSLMINQKLWTKTGRQQADREMSDLVPLNIVMQPSINYFYRELNY